MHSSPTSISGEQIERNEMCGAYSTYGGEGMCLKGFGEEM
jgi:hypothetical protein